MSPAPIACATCTEKPVAAALHNPPKSHVVVDISPIDAAGAAPRLPTIEASMYCMAIDENCANIDGMLSCTVSHICCPAVIALPSLIIESSRSVLFCSVVPKSFIFLSAKVQLFGIITVS